MHHFLATIRQIVSLLQERKIALSYFHPRVFATANNCLRMIIKRE